MTMAIAITHNYHYQKRANKIDSVFMTLLYACFFFLLINPVLTLNSNERRAAETKKETASTLAPNTNSNSKQSNGNQNPQHTSLSTTTTSSASINCSLPKYVNFTLCKDNDDGMVNYFLHKMSANSGMLFRTMYVLLAVTGVVIIYFVIKAIRVRRRRSKSRKYGIITKQGDHGDMEMEPLGDGADEDDDYTVFEMSRRK